MNFVSRLDFIIFFGLSMDISGGFKVKSISINTRIFLSILCLVFSFTELAVANEVMAIKVRDQFLGLQDKLKSSKLLEGWDVKPIQVSPPGRDGQKFKAALLDRFFENDEDDSIKTLGPVEFIFYAIEGIRDGGKFAFDVQLLMKGPQNGLTDLKSKVHNMMVANAARSVNILFSQSADYRNLMTLKFSSLSQALKLIKALETEARSLELVGMDKYMSEFDPPKGWLK